MKIIQHKLSVDEKANGMRFDQAVCMFLSEISRSRIQEWIKQGFITLNQKQQKAKTKVYIGDVLELDIPETTKTFDQPENIQFQILYEDEHLFVVNKPAGLVVHPAAGHASGTLVNGLLFKDESLQQLPRAGIVHRLDKDTTGVMVVARTLQAHTALVDALQRREVKREYVAVTQGVITAGRTIEAPIARHPVDRKKMSVQENGKHAVTHFKVREKFTNHSLIDVQLETGRTHQIRVHLSYLHYPLLGDQVYGGRLAIPAGISLELEQAIRQFKRQALHAFRLSFAHPCKDEIVSFEADLPDDLQNILAQLRKDSA